MKSPQQKVIEAIPGCGAARRRRTAHLSVYNTKHDEDETRVVERDTDEEQLRKITKRFLKLLYEEALRAHRAEIRT